jgi:hypothetical protein
MSTILKTLQGKFPCKPSGTVLIESIQGQMVLGTVRREAGPQKRWSKALKSKLTQGGSLDSSPLRSNGSRDDQAEGWTLREAAKDTQGRVRNQET